MGTFGVGLALGLASGTLVVAYFSRRPSQLGQLFGVMKSIRPAILWGLVALMIVLQVVMIVTGEPWQRAVGIYTGDLVTLVIIPRLWHRCQRRGESGS